jgi:hypothetical protein
MFVHITITSCTRSKLHGMHLATRHRMLWCALVCCSWLFATQVLSIQRNSEQCLCHPMAASGTELGCVNTLVIAAGRRGLHCEYFVLNASLNCWCLL